jgi:hypothetical protein
MNKGPWWSSSVYNTSNSWFRDLFYENGIVGRNYNEKPNGFSVRFIKD